MAQACTTLLLNIEIQAESTSNPLHTDTHIAKIIVGKKPFKLTVAGAQPTINQMHQPNTNRNKTSIVALSGFRCDYKLRTTKSLGGGSLANLAWLHEADI